MSNGPSPAEDDLDRALRELTSGEAGEARFRELSAAERAKAAARAGKEAKKRAREARRARKRAPSALKLARRQDRRKTMRKTASWITAIVILAGGGVLAWRHFAGKMPGTIAGTAVRSLGNSAVRTTTQAAPGADPFAGTPADHWANGAAGISVPHAAPHGPYTASQVSAAYAMTRKLLIAGFLDPVTLRGGPPKAFENLLTAQQRRDFAAGLGKTGKGKNGGELGTRVWVASFAPGTSKLIGNVIRVRGSMRARTGTDQGRRVLEIIVDYRFVYPVEQPLAPMNWMRVVGEVSGYVEFYHWQDPGGALQPWVMTTRSDAGGRCDTHDGFIHPEYPVGPPDLVQRSGKPIDPYSLKNHQWDSTTGCGMTTGT